MNKKTRIAVVISAVIVMFYIGELVTGGSEAKAWFAFGVLPVAGYWAWRFIAAAPR